MKTKTVNALVLGILGGAAATYASTDYGPAIWRPACSGHWYTSGYGHKFVVIHDMEGYYLTSVQYLQACSTSGSVHFCVNAKTDSSDGGADPGEISQSVRESYYSWHATCWNQYSFGTEHEGFRNNPAWFTEAQYSASADLQRHLCNNWGIAKDRNHVVGHDAKSSSAWCSYAESTFGCDAHCNTHDDPGPYWDWAHFMSLINGGAPASVAKVAYGPIAKNNDGRLEVFINGRNSHRPWHNYQSAANGSWSGFFDMGGTTTFKPGVEVEKNADGRVQIFAVGTDNAVYSNCQQSGGGWTGWMNFGGNVKGICVSANQDGRMELFQIGAATGYVWHKYQTAVNGAWSGWYQLGSVAMNQIYAIQNKDGRLELFGLCTDSSIKHIWQTSANGAWGSSWSNLGGSSCSLTVARNADGRLEVFGIGNNSKTLWHIWQTTAGGTFTSSWDDLGGATLTKVVVGANKDGRLEAFGLRNDTSIWHIWQGNANGGWGNWANLGGSSCSLAVASNADGRLELMAVGNSSKSLWHIWQGSANGAFGSWADMGGYWEDTF